MAAADVLARLDSASIEWPANETAAATGDAVDLDLAVNRARGHLARWI
ncbi:hypothetical protein [Nocardia carnea]|uniref:Uncharacterized protein n=1 Tax=Nocardia carnea TaxID=37328 RepID=A0ABW7TL54_9NOCA|nr:hypothetical protein [Nocardia carnea]